jgi:predicted DCC family thiol-disulfide oxidoreductase YuxK
MTESQHVRSKPLMVFDGDCRFCRLWIARWQSYTGDRVDYAPYQEIHEQLPQIPLEHFKTSVQLIEPDGKISSGADAVFRTLSYAPSKGWALWLYNHLPGFAPITESFYKLVATHRNVALWMTHFLWGNTVEPSSYSV